MFRLYRDILSRAHWGLPHFDGERTVDTPEQVVAGLVARGALKQPEWLKTLMQRQREFLREAAD